jgi:Integrase core domain/GAG-pre-integrase domain
MMCLNHERKPVLSGITAGSEGTMYEVEVYLSTGQLHQKDQSKPLPSSTVAAREAHARVTVIATHSHDKLTNIDTWHQRLGHVGYSVIEHMGHEQIVKGMNITTYEKGQGSWKDCIMGNHTRWPSDNPTWETEILERVYIDLWGPARTWSTGGKLYMMAAVDGKSTHTEEYYLAKKTAETTLEAFKTYHIMAERQTGKKLKCVRMDGGREFCNELWDSYCKEFGIIHEVTSPYSSQSNGVVECTNQTLIEQVQVLLHDSGLVATMWCEVASMVLYLKNFVPMA